MLLSTIKGHVYVMDAYNGRKVYGDDWIILFQMLVASGVMIMGFLHFCCWLWLGWADARVYIGTKSRWRNIRSFFQPRCSICHIWSVPCWLPISPECASCMSVYMYTTLKHYQTKNNSVSLLCILALWAICAV
jgi:hypothetical protein